MKVRGKFCISENIELPGNFVVLLVRAANIQTLETHDWAVESIPLGCPRMPEQGPGARAMLLRGPILT